MERPPHPPHPDACPVCGLGTLVERISRTTRVVAESPAMQAVLRRAHDFADSDAPVVIQGESGTGKEVVARALHAASPRRGKSFVPVNVAALPAELLESELFGHVRGAFTGANVEKKGLLEAAHGGTLFLDEIAELPLALQPKLLRALEDGEVRRVGDTQPFGVDVRFVCATHRDLSRAVAEGRFREDLFYRLKVLTLRLPALRERPEDVLPLARSFLAAERRPGPGFGPEAEALLLAHRWPGNVRELANVVRHAAALARGGRIEPEHLPDELRAPAPAPVESGTEGGAIHDGMTLAEVERAHVLRVLERCGGSQTEAARALGIGRNTLWRKLRGFPPTASPAADPRAPGRGRS